MSPEAEKYKEMMNDSAFRAKVEACSSVAELLQLLYDSDIILSEEEAVALKTVM